MLHCEDSDGGDDNSGSGNSCSIKGKYGLCLYVAELCKISIQFLLDKKSKFFVRRMFKSIVLEIEPETHKAFVIPANEIQ